VEKATPQGSKASELVQTTERLQIIKHTMEAMLLHNSSQAKAGVGTFVSDFPYIEGIYL
jgi:hypothetical protein